MNLSEKTEVRKIQRRENRTKVRQALLINEYIYCKYFAVYQEAAQYYNELNCLHPVKYDLRKCDEFKAWKMVTKGYPIRTRRKLSKPCHTAIPVMDVSSFTIVSEQHPEQSEQAANSDQPTSPEQHPEQSEQAANSDQPTSPEQHPEQSEQTANSDQPTSPEQHPEQSEQTANPEQMVNPLVDQKVMQPENTFAETLCSY